MCLILSSDKGPILSGWTQLEPMCSSPCVAGSQEVSIQPRAGSNLASNLEQGTLPSGARVSLQENSSNRTAL